MNGTGDGRSLKARIAWVYALLIPVNIGAWVWAWTAFHGHPLLMGSSMMAYSFGLRHAVDADHIAAVDNVTRKLMEDGQRPVTVGLFFSLGHSTVVFLASLVLVIATASFRDRLEAVHAIGGVIGTLVSVLFLLAISLINIKVLLDIHRTFRRVRAGGRYGQADIDRALEQGGLLTRLLRPLIRSIRHSWMLYPLGLLFGLGFDTATEIGLLGLSTIHASEGMALSSILIFPALFTAGMSLVDTTDGILMLGAYGWAFVKPLRKLFYNMAITFASVVTALVVGGIEGLGLIGNTFDLRGGFWDGVGALNAHFGMIGYLIILFFAASWLVASIAYRLSGWDAAEDGAL